MQAKEFFDFVVEMRENQKEYFRTRSKEALEKSKRIERVVDAEIARVKQILSEREKQKQQTK